MRRRLWAIGTALALSMIMSILVLAGCQTYQKESSTSARRTITVYGFSVEEEVLTKEIFPAFERYWHQQFGEEVVFKSVFTGSEEVASAIINGAPADVAILSNEQHAVWLHINDLVRTDWHSFPDQGFIGQSPLAIVVRPGNPLGIKAWDDLARPGVRLVHASPRTSGGAQWALLAEYGSAFLATDDREAAVDQLHNIWHNVIASPPSSREALRQFLFGVGNALVTYEQDALLAKSRGASIEVITPDRTIISEHVAVIVDRNVDSWERAVVDAFVSFLWSEAAQDAFALYYFRPVTSRALASFDVTRSTHGPGAPDFAEIREPFTVQDLGGWGQAYSDIIRGIWEEQMAMN